MRGFLIAWALVGAAFVGLLLIVSWPFYQKLERIRENKATVNGVEISVNCDPVSRGFAYDVNGKTYRWLRSFGSGFAKVSDHLGPTSTGDRNCRDQIGAPIIVYYEISNPANSIATDPNSVMWNDLIFVILVVLIFPPIIIWRFQTWRARGMPWIWNWP